MLNDVPNTCFLRRESPLMQLILIFPVYLFLPHAECPRASPAPADKHKPSMQGEVAGLGGDILQKVSVLFTEAGSTGAPGNGRARPESETR